MSTQTPQRREEMLPKVGYWWSEKKSQKINIGELEQLFREKGYQLVKLDLDTSLEKQGPFEAIIHKLSDVVVKVDQGDIDSARQVEEFEV